MAGTLLMHVGIDLFLEGVYDSFGRFDFLEYSGIWLITAVMTFYGMDAAMIAGVISALSTYAVQSITYLSPIRGNMSAATLRSSKFTRNQRASEILENPNTGRKRIFVIQLQGHLFFGNMAQLTEGIDEMLSGRRGTPDEPWIVILDFTLILGIDSSAAQAIVKLKGNLSKKFGVGTCIFVTGSSEGFPCEFDLYGELCTDDNMFSGSHIYDSMDAALIFAEDALVHRHDPLLLSDYCPPILPSVNEDSCMSEEREVAMHYLLNLCPASAQESDVNNFFSLFTREEYEKGGLIWVQGSTPDCAKLVIRGTLIALLENEAGTSETVTAGNIIGELGLVYGIARMSTVQCFSQDAVVYSLSRESYEQLVESNPRVARLLDMICIKYLSARVQHVSNRIFETRCLPI
jgi:SulP family sulfate permease